MKNMLLKVHKYISLTFVVIWMVQILSGLFMVFAPEITEARFSKPSVPLNMEVFEKSMWEQQAANPDWEPRTIYTTSKESTRFDVYFYHENSAQIGSRAIRIDGDGEILADRMMKWDFLNRAAEFHEMLWIDGFGYIILGVSGILLFTNMIIGLKMLWPMRKRWKSFFEVSAKDRKQIKLYKWHRLLGFCAALPALFVVFTGILNIWLDDFKDIFGNPWEAPVVEAVADFDNQKIITLSSAVEIALNTYPEASLSIISLPSGDDPYYMIRLLQEGEIREVYGNTKMYISALDGAVLTNYDQLSAPLKASLFSSFFSLHLGTPLGMPGRILVFVTGVLMLILGGFGTVLWWERRSKKRLKQKA
ncbi:MAG: PepSY domain-containing protein [Emcibacter sp.]|nr:PepSY domain-containing protein [Emcibacter sp.]